MDLITELQQRKQNVEKLEGGRKMVKNLAVCAVSAVFQTSGDDIDFYFIVDLVFMMLFAGIFS